MTMDKYTDETMLTFGKHKFTRLCRVPPEYLLTFLENKAHKELHEYVTENLERILMRRDGLLEAPPLEFPCAKITYRSKKDANWVLAKIKDVEQAHKKPIRSYECDKCGGWHLTSKPI